MECIRKRVTSEEYKEVYNVKSEYIDILAKLEELKLLFDTNRDEEFSEKIGIIIDQISNLMYNDQRVD